MERLKYEIGGLDIDPSKMGMIEGERLYRQKLIEQGKPERVGRHIARHLFAVHYDSDLVRIYVTNYGYRHSHVLGKFNLPDNDGDKEEPIVGGGNCWMDTGDILTLDDFSGDFGSIPKAVAQTFAELMIPELEFLGIKINGVKANPNKDELRFFWKNKGFSE